MSDFSPLSAERRPDANSFRSLKHTAMTSFLALFLGLALALPSGAEGDPPKLLGQCAQADMQGSDDYPWFDENYDAYVPNAEILEQLKALPMDDVEISVFFGTWCGDSKREVPRWQKLMDTLGVDAEKWKLIALDNKEPLYRQSPDGEEQGMHIYRVPTMVISRQGKEIGRLIEHPVFSLERDLLSLLQGQDYSTAYPAYPQIRQWLEAGLLDDPNVSADGLAVQLRNHVGAEAELKSVENLLRAFDKRVAAAKINQTNCALFSKSADCVARLAHALWDLESYKEAHRVAERALERLPAQVHIDSDTTELLLYILQDSQKKLAKTAEP